MFEPVTTGVVPSDAQNTFADGVSEAWADAGGKDEAASSIPEPRSQGTRASDERALKADRFAKRSDENVGFYVDGRGDATSCGTEGSDSVSFVDDEGGIVLVAEGPKTMQIGDIAIHAEVRFSDDPTAPCMVGMFKSVGYGVGVEMRCDDDGCAGEPTAIDDGGVVERVGDDDIAGLGEGAQGTDVGGVT